MSTHSPASSAPRGRPVLLVLALLIAAGVAGWWYAAGANRGWYKSQVPVKQTDEVTGVEFVTYEKRFVPGVDVLGAGLGFAALLAGVSFFRQKKPKS